MGGRGHGWLDGWNGIGGRVGMTREEEIWYRYLTSENIVTIRESVFLAVTYLGDYRYFDRGQESIIALKLQEMHRNVNVDGIGLSFHTIYIFFYLISRPICIIDQPTPAGP